MHRNSGTISVKKSIILFLVILNVIILRQAFVAGADWGIFVLLLLPILFMGFLLPDSFSFSSFRRRSASDRSKVLLYMSQLGSRYNLSFSSQEVLKDAIMGVDGVKRKLLILRGSRDTELQISLIDLNLLQSCSVKTYYGRIGVGGLKNRRLKSYVERICLHFEFENESQPLEIPFFQDREQEKDELEALEQKAFYWKTILSKMIIRPMKEAG